MDVTACQSMRGMHAANPRQEKAQVPSVQPSRGEKTAQDIAQGLSALKNYEHDTESDDDRMNDNLDSLRDSQGPGGEASVVPSNRRILPNKRA